MQIYEVFIQTRTLIRKDNKKNNMREASEC